MKARLLILLIHCLLLSVGARAQYGSDLGPKSVSTLAWDHISSVFSTNLSNNNTGNDTDGSIGLTTDKRMYVWGMNIGYTIHTGHPSIGATPLAQTAPFYVPSPAGETIKKVQVKSSKHTTTGEVGATYFALSESGKLYAWGFNNGLLATTWPVAAGAPANTLADTTRNKRRPVQLTILTESTFVDFDVSSYGDYWLAIGASGKAYHIGNNGLISGGGQSVQYTFAALPNPAGVDNATFKYVRVWVSKIIANSPIVYLKGNNGKLYYTGYFLVSYVTGVPSVFARNTPAPTLNTAETFGNVRTIVPREVPLPAGVDIVKMEITGNPSYDRQTTYALSADGKGYMTGLWKAIPKVDINNALNYVTVPLKTAPQSSEVDVFYQAGQQDTTYVLKNFVEIAMPPGATKILDIMSHEKQSTVGFPLGCSVVGDNNKVYWSGTLGTGHYTFPLASNYLSVSPTIWNDYRCFHIQRSNTTTPYTWSEESINLEGTSQMFLTTSSLSTSRLQIGIISKTRRGYFLGDMSASAGTGKTLINTDWTFSPFPTPIANEQLLDCQTSPGTGGPLTGPVTPTNTAVGTIDCSKTQIAPAPVAGVPSQTTLIVSVNVTTAGTFTPITVSGSGMSLGNGITSVSTTTTGVQTFYIPLQYDGTALTNAFQFTVGSAGSCTADLTQKPNQQVTNVWSLTNCSAITPGSLSK